MPAYIHAEVEVHDPVAYEDYRRQVAGVLAQYGGRFIVRGGAAELLEGEPAPQRQVILEFADMAALKAFYHSPEYAPLIALRQRVSTARLVAVQGV
jgi:uncharacterized protein (DUF1330 family)